MYIIIYNGESDFIKTYDKEQAQTQIEALIKGGYAADDIELYCSDQVSFSCIIESSVTID